MNYTFSCIHRQVYQSGNLGISVSYWEPRRCVSYRRPKIIVVEKTGQSQNRDITEKYKFALNSMYHYGDLEGSVSYWELKTWIYVMTYHTISLYNVRCTTTYVATLYHVRCTTYVVTRRRCTTPLYVMLYISVSHWGPRRLCSIRRTYNKCSRKNWTISESGHNFKIQICAK